MDGLAHWIETAPITFKHIVVSAMPSALQPLVHIALVVLPVVGFFSMLFAFLTWMERKVLARIQNRPGPNRVGLFGLLQPVADGIKMLTKQDIIPIRADVLLHTLAPIAIMVPSVTVFALIPFGQNMVAVDLAVGLLAFFAIAGTTELAVFLAGWSSHNRYSLLGALRAIAQMISYEMPLILSVLPVVMMCGSLSLASIVEQQAGGIGGWHVATPWGLAGFILFFIAGLAESNRAPFDLPEAESELIAGHLTEYSGFKYALFFMAEYFGMCALTGLAVTLFLGGWQAPVEALEWIPSYGWFFIKMMLLLTVYVWVRGSLPRLRSDQLMDLAWKTFLPLVLVNLVGVVLWHLSEDVLPLWQRWLHSGGLVAIVFMLMMRSNHQHVHKRVYRWVDS